MPKRGWKRGSLSRLLRPISISTHAVAWNTPWNKAKRTRPRLIYELVAWDLLSDVCTLASCLQRTREGQIYGVFFRRPHNSFQEFRFFTNFIDFARSVITFRLTKNRERLLFNFAFFRRNTLQYSKFVLCLTNAHPHISWWHLTPFFLVFKIS